MKKRFLLLSIISMLVLVLSSCHGNQQLPEFVIPDEFDETQEYNISFWAKNDTNPDQQAIYNNAITEFEKLYPNINVEIVQYNDYTKIYADVIKNISTQTTPNVCIAYPDHVATYKEGNNVVAPLTNLINNEAYGLGGSKLKFDSIKKEEIAPKFLNECTIGDDYYIIPFMRSTEALYVNKTYLEENGFEIPEIFSWDYVWEICEYAYNKNENDNQVNKTNKKMIPLIYKSTDNMFIQLCKQYGYDYTSDKGEVFFLSDDVNKMLVDIGKKAEAKYFDTFKRISYPGNYFNKGQCIFAIDSTAGATWIGSDAPLIDLKDQSEIAQFETIVRPIPQVDVDNPQMISQGPSICVFNKANNQEVLASWIFAQYLLTNETQINYAKTEGYLPVTTKATASQDFIDYMNDESEYKVKRAATQLIIDNIDDTFITPVFNGSSMARSASGYLIEAVFADDYRDEASINELFSNVDTRFNLSTYVIDSNSKPANNDSNLGYILFGALGTIWIGIVGYVVVDYLKKKR